MPLGKNFTYGVPEDVAPFLIIAGLEDIRAVCAQQINGTYVQWFFADSRPGRSYHTSLLTSNPTLAEWQEAIGQLLEKRKAECHIR